VLALNWIPILNRDSYQIPLVLFHRDWSKDRAGLGGTPLGAVWLPPLLGAATRTFVHRPSREPCYNHPPESVDHVNDLGGVHRWKIRRLELELMQTALERNLGKRELELMRETLERNLGKRELEQIHIW
jgi:hypothetical protein